MNAVTLVTGATGFIGRYVVARLLEQGSAVRVLARRPDALPDDVRRCADVVTGDVRDSHALARAVDGVRTILHLAACAKAWSRDPDEFAAVNVRALATLLNLAAAARVERLVGVSSIVTLPPFKPAPLAGRSRRPTPYERTKHEGERMVEAYATSGRHAVIVHPTRVYGPGPLHDANGVTKAIALYLRGRLRVRLGDGDAMANYVHADDVAAGIILAAERGRPGAHYLLGGENASLRELLKIVSDLTGVRRRVMTVPPRTAVAVGELLELWGRVGGSCPITRGWIRILLEDRRVDIAPVREQLGYRPRSLRDGLRQTIAWLAANGHIPAS